MMDGTTIEPNCAIQNMHVRLTSRSLTVAILTFYPGFNAFHNIN